jgi:hypothetical protein
VGVRFRYHAGGHARTRDVNVQEPQIHTNSLVQADQDPLILDDNAVWALQAAQVERLRDWNGTGTLVLRDEEISAVEMDAAVESVHDPEDVDNVARFPEIDPESWYDVTGTRFTGGVRVYLEKFEFFRFDRRSDEFWDLFAACSSCHAAAPKVKPSLASSTSDLNNMRREDAACSQLSSNF